ncbi:MAG: response regulator transcription factor [Chloroflexota bacterium]
MLVDNDASVIDALCVGLRFQWKDAAVVVAGDGDTAIELFQHERPDLVMLEADLPGKSGYEVVKEIRWASDVPVIMLAAKSGELDQVLGFEMGADAYIAKPFSSLALLARVKAVLRRAYMPPPARMRSNLLFEDLCIDLMENQVTVRDRLVKLTPTEHKLLCYLALHAGRVVTHQALAAYSYGSGRKIDATHLKVFISRMRAKIEIPNGLRYIETVRGFGYRFIGEEKRT